MLANKKTTEHLHLNLEGGDTVSIAIPSNPAHTGDLVVELTSDRRLRLSFVRANETDAPRRSFVVDATILGRDECHLDASYDPQIAVGKL
jgi:hypothetical protein